MNSSEHEITLNIMENISCSEGTQIINLESIAIKIYQNESMSSYFYSTTENDEDFLYHIISITNLFPIKRIVIQEELHPKYFHTLSGIKKIRDLIQTKSNNKNLSVFIRNAHAYNIFQNQSSPNKRSADKVADYWYSFSQLMPTILRSAASNITTKEQRTSLLEISKEEDGEIEGTPHYIMFKESCEKAEINPQILDLKVLRDLMHFASLNFDATILGLCFGLEVIANENIDYLFNNICWKECHRADLEKTLFFKIHRVNEDRHISSNFENYSRYCQTEESKHQFDHGFEFALSFWKNFWAEAKTSTSILNFPLGANEKFN